MAQVLLEGREQVKDESRAGRPCVLLACGAESVRASWVGVYISVQQSALVLVNPYWPNVQLQFRSSVQLQSTRYFKKLYASFS
jgi:hypothetical protein